MESQELELSLSEAKEKGYVVRSSEEESAFIENLKNNVLKPELEKDFKTQIDEKTLEIASNLEKDIFETTNIPKGENEKYYKYLKRTQKILGNKPLSDEEKAVTESTGYKVPVNPYTDQLESLSKRLEDYETKLKSKEEELANKDKGILQAKKQIYLDTLLDNLDFFVPSHIEGESSKAYVTSQRKLVASEVDRLTAVEHEGKLVYYDGDKPILDDKNGFMDLNSIVKSRFGILLKPTSPSGSGSKGAAVPQPRLDRESFDGLMKQKGYILGSPEYTKAYKENFN